MLVPPSAASTGYSSKQSVVSDREGCILVLSNIQPSKDLDLCGSVFPCRLMLCSTWSRALFLSETKEMTRIQKDPASITGKAQSQSSYPS